jgi:hypothetical protein
MITVTIFINGQPIITRSAVNKGPALNDLTRYCVDDGSAIFHKPEDGAVKLAIEMLKTVHTEEF